jgi:hypothetical protein
MERDRPAEQETLTRLGASPAYAEEVIARLDRYEAEHGNSGWTQDLDRLLEEIQQEAADITGWGIGAARQLEPDDPLLANLMLAMRYGAMAHRELEVLRTTLATREQAPG